jgi:tRNA nucleotidyltransferase (CCA-adding enzyme)
MSKTEALVLRKISPPAKPPAIVATTLKRVESAIKRLQILAEVKLGGSLAKGTYLQGDHDVDVFVRFSTKYRDEELAEHLERILKSVFKTVERVHGSRDYFHVQRGSFTFEFIPVLHISSWAEANNVTDMSPLHVAYVRQHIERNSKLAGDIRLTKQFAKAAKIYGAESYIGGFSGHVIDLLNIYYGGFHELLEAAAKWPAKVVIDPERKLTNPLTQLNDAKVYSPLVIVDPIQQDRNSAAALTEYAFKRFKEAAKEYLRTTDQMKFFTIISLSVSSFKKTHRDAKVIAVEIAPLTGKKDVIGAKCFKIYQNCVQQLLEHQFKLIDSQWEFTPKKALLLFAVDANLLPAQEELPGPPIHRTADVARFKTIHKTTFTKDRRIYALESRKWRDAKKLLAHLLKQPYARERMKRHKIL